LAQGAPDQALRIAECLLATGPGTSCGQPIPVLLKLKGEALLAMHHPKEALLALAEARRGAEERSERTLLWPILRTLGQAHQQVGQRKEAQGAFAAARDVIEFLAATIGESGLREQFLRMALESVPQARPPTPRRLAAERFSGLTARERQVLRQITQGKSNQEIADALVVSKRTVESHVGSIMTKLGVTTRARIAVWALEVGVLEDTE
jgi:DNA-binding CsgD family transcriptional regulator